MARWSLVLGVLAAGCGEWTADPDGFTEQELALVRGMALPATENAAVETSMAGFGQRLFFDATLSAPSPNGPVTCADCHDPRAFFSDVRSTPNNVSLGLQWTFRNSPALTNVAQYKSFSWDGRSDSLLMQTAIAYESPRTMGGSHLRLARALWLNPLQRARYAALQLAPPLTADLDPSSPNGGRFIPPTLADGGTGPLPEAERAYVREVAFNAYSAMAQYMALLDSTGSPFDRFALDGDREAMDADARKGLKLFLGKAGCIECHRGQQFTDNGFHVLGLAQSGPNVPLVDEGRFTGITQLNASPYKSAALDPPTDSDKGAFRTKSLRNVGETGPWMHAGQFDRLEDVVRYYHGGGDRAGPYQVTRKLQPLELTDAEQRQLVSFLHALTGVPVPEAFGCGDPFPDGGSRFPVCP